jgi:hypothetical protein
VVVPVAVAVLSEDVLQKHQLSLQAVFDGKPHGVTSQKTPFFIVTAVETSNLTTLRLTISQQGGEGFQVDLMSHHSGQQIFIPITICLLQKLRRD